MLNEIEQTGQNVRDYYQRRLPSDSSKDYYYILRNTPNTEALLIEYGFLDSSGDDVEQLKNNWQEYAEAIVKAVTEYIGVPYYVESDEYYIVEKGDSLWSIAKKFNTTVDRLKSINNLTSNLLSIGQRLKISEAVIEDNSEYYTVKSGDTLYSIAGRYGLTVNELKELNNLSSNSLSIGQKLVVEKVPTSGTDINTYVVKSGDTLYSIAKKYNTTVSQLSTLNNLNSSSLSIGQVLKVPVDMDIIYTVVKGDSLYSIARKFNTTVSALSDKNNLSTSVLSIGQKLIIP